MGNEPSYSKINPAELRDLEDEFGAPLTPEMALWLIRNRINREAVERMEHSAESQEAKSQSQEQERHLALPRVA